MRDFFYTFPIRIYLEHLREQHRSVEFDYIIDLETYNDLQGQYVYAVSHSNAMAENKTFYRFKVIANPNEFSVCFFCAIPGVFTSKWVTDEFEFEVALDEIYESKTMKGMRGLL